MSIVILFGAGASHGAEGVIPLAPPLGTTLYEELSLMFPQGWGNFSQSIQEQFRNNFEEGMSSLWDSGSHAIPLLMQQMAIFFARYLLYSHRIDNYSKLLDNILPAAKPIFFSSLNYDCLFEIAVSMSGRSINYFANAPASDSDIIIWKLHGSCNFLPHGGVTATRGVSFGTGIQPVNPSQVLTYCTGNTALYPVMAVYSRGKPVQIASQIIQQIQKFWATAIESASTVVIIGVNPYPVDSHIWQPLSTTKAKLLFVGNENTFSIWRSEYRRDKDSVYLGSHFGSCIEAISNNL